MAVSCTPETAKFLPIIQDVAEASGITNYEVWFNNNSVVNGYICSIVEVEITSKIKQLSLIIKTSALTDKIRNIMPIPSIFKIETYMYKYVFPLFEQFVTEHDINPTKFAPKFYNTYSNNEYDALVLNNLKSEAFLLYNKEDFLDEKHVKLGLEHYAKLHAISLAYREQKPSEFKSVIDKMEVYPLSIFKHGGFIDMFKAQMSKLADLLKNEMGENVMNVYNNFVLEMEDYVLGTFSMVDEYSAMIHGDCWKNNLLFKYDANDSKTPTDIRLIDFQFSKFASPMLDIASFFYACSSKEVVDNMSKYLDFYYEKLSKHVKDLGSNVEKLYPREVMMKHWKAFGRFGLILRTGAISISLSSQDNKIKGISDTLEEDGNVSKLFDYKISNLKKFKDLNKHTIEHFVQFHLSCI